MVCKKSQTTSIRFRFLHTTHQDSLNFREIEIGRYGLGSTGHDKEPVSDGISIRWRTMLLAQENKQIADIRSGEFKYNLEGLYR